MIMATRTKGEREAAEKKRRIERTVIPIICALAIAVFIVLSALFGKARDRIEPEPTPAPTEDPIIPTAENLKELLDGKAVTASGFSVVSYQSETDGAYGTVTVYPKNELVCLRVTRSLYLESEPTPDPYADMFENPVKTEGPEVTGDASEAEVVCDELIRILTCAYGQGPEAGDSIVSAVRRLLDGAKKTSAVYGIYLLEFEYSEADCILTLTCEPA